MADIGAYEARTKFSALLKRVAKGERFTITHHGVALAELVPAGQVPRRDAATVIAELRKFRKGNRLRGLKVRDMIEEGRR
ncbi:MAG: type II toxin-antitoxin system prevent-host-death family antitoxin [Alphaproteobacteria bacterium]|nr:type II toxin-antitoxin system prevent-host-death family antitoxin [Alphaproteobacteria bacterium]